MDLVGYGSSIEKRHHSFYIDILRAALANTGVLVKEKLFTKRQGSSHTPEVHDDSKGVMTQLKRKAIGKMMHSPQGSVDSIIHSMERQTSLHIATPSRSQEDDPVNDDS